MRPWPPRREAGAAEVGRRSAAAATSVTRTVRAAGHRTTRPVVNFFAGIGCFWRGLGRFLTSPMLWLYAVAPLLLLALALIGLNVAAKTGAGTVAEWATSFAEDWPDWIHAVMREFLRWTMILAMHAGLSYLVLPLSIVLGAPCYVLLVRRVERTLGPIAIRPPGLWRACAIAIRQAVLVTLVLHFGWLLLVPLLLLPGVNLLIAVCAVIVLNGFLVGWLVLSIPLQHHGITAVGAQFRAVWRHRASAIGFGATGGIILAIPMTWSRAIVAPAVFTGAVLLHRRMRQAEEARREMVQPRLPWEGDRMMRSG